MKNSQFDWQTLKNAQNVIEHFSAKFHQRISNVLNMTDWRTISGLGEVQQDIDKLRKFYNEFFVRYHAFDLQHLSIDLEQRYQNSITGKKILRSIAIDDQILYRQTGRERASWTDPMVFQNYMDLIHQTFPDLIELEDDQITEDSQPSDQQEQQLVKSRQRAYSQGGIRYGKTIWLDLNNVHRPLRMTISLPSDLQVERFHIEQHDKLIQYYKKGVTKEELFEQDTETPIQQVSHETQIIEEGHTSQHTEIIEELIQCETDIDFENDSPQMNSGQISEEQSVKSEEMTIYK